MHACTHTHAHTHTGREDGRRTPMSDGRRTPMSPLSALPEGEHQLFQQGKRPETKNKKALIIPVLTAVLTCALRRRNAYTLKEVGLSLPATEIGLAQ